MRSTSANGVSQTLEDWEAVPIAAPLGGAGEAAKIKRAWTPIRVPWHWQLDDAFAAYEGFVLYRCRFAHRSPPEGAMVTLLFEGVYYAARVWLNGVYMGDHEGYFSAFEFDVTDVVATEGENELLVEVFSPEESEENDRKTIGGVWAMWDGMAHHINPGGIFKEVRVVLDGEIRIRSLETAADHTGRGVAHVDLYSRRNTRARLVGRVRPLGSEVSDVEFEREVQIDVGQGRAVALRAGLAVCRGRRTGAFWGAYRGVAGLEGLPQRRAYILARDQLPSLGRLSCKGDGGMPSRGRLPGA